MIKSVILKIITFILVFVTVAYVTNRIGNNNMESLSAEMNNATLPVVYTEYGDDLVNQLHGYTNALDISLLRDSIMPIGKEKEISFWIGGADNRQIVYSYEVRSLDGSLIEDGQMSDVRMEDGYVKCCSKIRMDLVPNQEYSYTLLLSEGQEVIRYYTRIVVEEGRHVSELLAFVKKFHGETFVKDEENSMMVFKLETNAQGNNDDLAQVSIHSSYDTVTYAGMAPVVISQVVPMIQEINEQYCIFKLDFVLAAGDETVTNHYNVTEYYKVAYIDSKTIYLLDYQRSQNELYHYNNVNTVKNWFKLGVGRTEQMEYLTSDGEKRVAFVREGQLWYYDYAKTNIIRVFGFWQEDYLNVNNTYDQHDIRLISMDNQGNIAFAVSGYMNRGNHEGHTGIAVYRYVAESNRTEELMFVEIDMPYEQLSAYTDKLMYLSENNIFYYYLQGNIYRVDMSGEMSVIAENLPADAFAVSEDNSRIAYPAVADAAQNSQVTIMDLKTEEASSYSVPDQECIQAVGFVGEDFVCGRAMREETAYHEDGTLFIPLYKLEVMDMNKNILKEYQQDGMYLFHAYTKGQDIYFDRAKKLDNTYEVMDQDFITYKEMDTTEKIEVVYRYSQTSLNLMYMVFPSYIYVKTVPRLLITKEVIRNQSAHVKCEGSPDYQSFYVYNTCGLTGTYNDASQALANAFQTRGIVLNQKGSRLWQNTELPEYFTIDEQIEPVTGSQEDSLALCMQMALAYNGIQEELEDIKSYEGKTEHLFDDRIGRTGLRLMDVSLDTMLYYLSHGIPVIAEFEGGHYVLLTSYNSGAVRYVDPVTGESTRLDRTSFVNRMKAAGNVYITYAP